MLSSAHFNGAREVSDTHAMDLSLSLAGNDLTILRICVGYFTAIANDDKITASTYVERLDKYYKSQEAK